MKHATAAAAFISVVALEDATRPAHAEGGRLTASTTLTSDYVYYGQSQSARHGAVQGDIVYTFPSGLFLSVWASTIDFNDAQETPVETDWMVGYSFALSERTSVVLTGIYYWYPASAPANYDGYALMTDVWRDCGGFSLGGSLAIFKDVANRIESGVAVSGAFSVPVAGDWLTASGRFGRQWMGNNDNWGTPDWLFFDIGMTAKWRRFALDVRYGGTDTRRSECFGGADVCKPGVFVSLKTQLPLP